MFGVIKGGQLVKLGTICKWLAPPAGQPSHWHLGTDTSRLFTSHHTLVIIICIMGIVFIGWELCSLEDWREGHWKASQWPTLTSKVDYIIGSPCSASCSNLFHWQVMTSSGECLIVPLIGMRSPPELSCKYNK